MPSRNVVKQLAPHQYYHIYNRGINKRKIFMDERDYMVFLSYLKVALSPELEKENKQEALSAIEEGRLRRLRLHDKIDLLAYCLMPNHFHLLIYQKNDAKAISSLMRSVMNGYVHYFNKRYKRSGSLMQGRYRGSLIDEEDYLWHISRYIHLNPQNWQVYLYSSYRYYIGSKRAVWLKSDKILKMHSQGAENYKQFLSNYEDYRNSMDDMRLLLAS